MAVDATHDQKIATQTTLMPQKAEVDHFALPEHWQLSEGTKTKAAVFMVVAMASLSLYGIVVTIQTSIGADFVCRDVTVD